MTKANTNAARTASIKAMAAEIIAKTNPPTDEQMVAQGLDSLSARIRHLDAMGLSKGDIRKIVKRSNGEHPLYQHVRNVLLTPLKKQPVASKTEAAVLHTDGATK